jgi:uncharacterized damage-inducible protein DinB
MDSALAPLFLRASVGTLQELHARIAACLDKLTYEQIWAKSSGNENAVGNLVLHLCGNVRQWIGFGIAGLANIRERDKEFAATGEMSGDDLKQRLADTVDQACAILEKLTPERLAEAIAVQGYTKSALEGVFHVVEHFSMHTGQILYITKHATGEDLGFFRHLSGTGMTAGR